MQLEYSLPFSETVEKRIVGSTGEYAHANFPESRYAIDFLLGVGTPILAARGGRVIRIKSDSDNYGLDVKLANEANYVVIDHGDGTYSEYIHLEKARVEVREGQDVKTGELLGYSGLSGCMSRPHLHFNTFKIKGGKGVSIPVEFTEPAPL